MLSAARLLLSCPASRCSTSTSLSTRIAGRLENPIPAPHEKLADLKPPLERERQKSSKRTCLHKFLPTCSKNSNRVSHISEKIRFHLAPLRKFGYWPRIEVTWRRSTKGRTPLGQVRGRDLRRPLSPPQSSSSPPRSGISETLMIR